MKIPYIVTVRGNTDIKVLKYKVLYRILYKAVASGARRTILLAPWTNVPIRHYLGDSVIEKSVVIPNLCQIKTQIPGGEIEKHNKFLAVLSYRNSSNKGIKNIIQACDLFFNEYPDYRLDIAGGDSEYEWIRTLIVRAKHSNKYQLLGQVKHNKLVDMYGRYKCFIHPSYPETFGLVLLEALHGNTPIIYCQGAAVDGYFDQWPVGIKVRPDSVSDIVSALHKIVEKQELYVKGILEMKKVGYLERFSPVSVEKQYREVVQSA